MAVSTKVGAGSWDVNFLLSDHLGSTSLTVDADGDRVSEMRYSPWGSVRFADGVSPTDIGFNGQRSRTDLFGLVYFKARWLDPALGRFVSPDSIIPSLGNPISWDRYAAMMNNPLRYMDPSGHKTCAEMPWECDEEGEWLGEDPLPEEPEPWADDNSTKDWGDGTGSDNDKREEMAEKVWDWIHQSDYYWWGEGELDAYNLIAWLVWQELGELLRYSVYWPNGGNPANPDVVKALTAAIGYMNRLFTNEDGITPLDLSTFTAFYNPERDSVFDQKDWNLLMSKPPQCIYDTIDYYKNAYTPGIVVWRDPSLPNEPIIRIPIVTVYDPT